MPYHCGVRDPTLSLFSKAQVGLLAYYATGHLLIINCLLHSCRLTHSFSCFLFIPLKRSKFSLHSLTLPLSPLLLCGIDNHNRFSHLNLSFSFLRLIQRSTRAAFQAHTALLSRLAGRLSCWAVCLQLNTTTRRRSARTFSR